MTGVQTCALPIYCADLGYRGVAGLIVWKRRVARHDYPVLGKNGLMTEEMNQGV